MAFNFGFTFDIEGEKGTIEVQKVPQSVEISPEKNAMSLEIIPANSDANARSALYESMKLPLANISLKRAIPYDTSIDEGRDIVPGVYEGGFKCWECSRDLAMYLFANYRTSSQLSELSGAVVDLGCGHGFPGIAALMLGARRVVFSDMNAEVLSQVTWPNIQLNCTNRIEQARALCVAGDFAHLPEWWASSASDGAVQPGGVRADDQYEQGRVALVLSAETLYTQAVTTTVFHILERMLTAPGSFALLANKRYYFGCGGGTMSFLDLCTSPSSSLEARIVSSVEDGKSNIRDILLVTPKQKEKKAEGGEGG